MIAAEIGVDKDTVREARKRTGEPSPVDPPKRIGRDGKSRALPKPGRRKSIRQFDPTEGADDNDERSIESDIDPQHLRTAFLLRADQARQFAAYSGRVDDD
jgi:hypothetical protein